MLVVSDTSPLANLAIVGRLELLREQFTTVWMPPAVARELAALRNPEAKTALGAAVETGWLREVSVPTGAPYPAELRGLDAGETEALRLALGLHADRVLGDEKEGRQRAAMLGLRTIGVIGVLIVARKTGRLPSLAVEIARLRRDAGFFVDHALEMRALALVGE